MRKDCFDSLLNTNKFSITINDGIFDHQLNAKEVMEWKGKLFSPYGHISILFKKTDTSRSVKELFFGNNYSKITVITNNNFGEWFSVIKDSSSDIKSYEELGGDLLDSFTRATLDGMVAFYKTNRHKLTSDPTLLQESFRLGDLYGLK